MIIKRSSLTNKVYFRLNKEISKTSLYDSLHIICEELSNKIADGQSISIVNFGTFFIYEYPSRTNVDIISKIKRKTKPFNNIKFIPDKVFSELLKYKRLSFKKSVDKQK